ncbi:hypothetical protein BJX63DRAFT_445530 [Aspergillus granulosus]|uniref:Uncharacterized protein n=1 Tax=Aspergillus granulosus TaxID=176169 RepID=A0ABR4H0W0_9EURO
MLALSSALTLTPQAAEGDPVDLPAGVAPSDVRKCLDHPLGQNRHVKGASLAPLDAVDASFYNSTVDIDTSPMEARSDGLGARGTASYKDAPYGCSSGYCWKACGTTTYACRRGGCPACGCGC